LRWLACFHGQFLGVVPEFLWSTGTYWHLETRPDELKVLGDTPLARSAVAIDRALAQSPFQTIVHGDAKLANFCFSKERFSKGSFSKGSFSKGEESEDCGQVAAVDFQYVGGGIGMKDVAYFLGSCLDDLECEANADMLLDLYFEALAKKLVARNMHREAREIEQSWRPLFPTAWADFHRFLKGWSPDHWKINSYSERVTQMVVKELQQQ
jgi:thiamine kinase-like enzyme